MRKVRMGAHCSWLFFGEPVPRFGALAVALVIEQPVSSLRAFGASPRNGAQFDILPRNQAFLVEERANPDPSGFRPNPEGLASEVVAENHGPEYRRTSENGSKEEERIQGGPTHS